MISIVIPVYNEQKNISALIDSILGQSFKKYELIIVDDKSTDKTVEFVKKYKNKKIKLIELENNSGPAKARNVGVENAKYEIVLFLDSDVIVHSNVLEKVDKFFKENKKAISLIGIYSKNPVNKGFTPKFKALLDYHIFTGEKLETVTSFEPRCGAVKIKVFKETGGFDTRFRGADVEDYEFGYRLLEKGSIYIDTSIQVDHNFPHLKTLFKNFLKRGYQWFNLFLQRKKFDNVGTTQGAVLSRGFSFLSLPLFIASIFYFPIIYTAILSFFIGLFGNLKFYQLIMRETNFIFTLKSIVVDYTLSVLLGISALTALITYPFKSKI